ncbi:MAG: cytochrome C oxidase subunit I [Methylibium sp. NZG]|nr:MAG: cytochrome C oxidase subunit I [Methylibium sp. NZG]
MDSQPLFDLTPAVRLALLGVVLAAGPLAWVWLRHRGSDPATRLRALTWLTLFLTFDLVLFGAFTRLTDSGLGCPDWPGCYGSASPIGAREEINSAQAALPTGPVTPKKAWIEMTHRYLATGVGVLIIVITLASWALARRRQAVLSPWWATLTLVWVCLQGLFGALTVTMKLYPAIVTLHLLGGMGLLALLAGMGAAMRPEPLAMSASLRQACIALAALVVLQIALGGWVSTNYAVLACSDFPRCQGSWWPAMDFEQGFALQRELGAGKDGGYLPFAALTAIHYVHRLGAYVVLAVLALLAWRLHATGDAALRRWAVWLVAAALWQVASGLGNVLLGWPLWAAVAHTGGAAALVVLLSVMIVRASPSRAPAAPAGAARPAMRVLS